MVTVDSPSEKSEDACFTLPNCSVITHGVDPNIDLILLCIKILQQFCLHYILYRRCFLKGSNAYDVAYGVFVSSD